MWVVKRDTVVCCGSQWTVRGRCVCVCGCVTRHMEHTLERLLQTQAAMEELAVALEQAEGVRDAWEPVGDLFIDSLQDHIDATKVQLRAYTQRAVSLTAGQHRIDAIKVELGLAHTHTHIHTDTQM